MFALLNYLGLVMVANEIQEARMKTYFIEAAKEIIKGEGIRCINVRNVAQKAGYSYATLYNYFKNLKDLIFLCTVDYVQEIKDFVFAQELPKKNGLTHLEAVVKAYCKYFIQYTSIFDLLFLEKMPEISNQERITSIVYSCFDELVEDDWAAILQNNVSGMSLDDKGNFKAMIHGLLLFYLNRRNPQDYASFQALLKRSIDSFFYRV